MKALTTKQLAKHVYNISNAIASFQDVEPMSINMITSDIEYISNRFSNFIILVDKNTATVKVASHDCFQGDFLEFKVTLWDNRFYVEI